MFMSFLLIYVFSKVFNTKKVNSKNYGINKYSLFVKELVKVMHSFSSLVIPEMNPVDTYINI